MTTQPQFQDSLTPAGAERVLDGVKAAAAAEMLLERTERLASQEGREYWMGKDVKVEFCRGFAGHHKPHFVYAVKVGRFIQNENRESVLAHVTETIIMQGVGAAQAGGSHSGGKGCSDA